MSQFMYFRESKTKFLTPNSFSTMAEITPTMSLVVEIPETSEDPTCYVPRHQQHNGYPNNKEVYNTLVFVFTHTDTHTWRLHGRSWQAKFSGRARQRKGR